MTTGKIQTVLGQIEPGELGITQTHEHLVTDLIDYFEMPEEASERAWVDAPVTMERRGGLMKRFMTNRDNIRLLDEAEAVQEILKYRHAGGGGLVDTSNIGLARDPLALARIARATGLNIVMGASWYVPLTYPPELADRSEEDMTAEIVRDLTVGVGETGVRAGVIGEVGNFWPTTETTLKVLRASAKASVETGAAVLIHPGFHPDSPPHILNTLMEAGADPKRIIMGHLDVFAVDRGWLRDLGQSGCYMEWDTFGLEDTSLGGGNLDHARVSSDVQRLEVLELMMSEGFGDQIVIGHDVCTKFQRAKYGGKGYAHIIESIVPRMRSRGFSDSDINGILVENPARALAF
jgi:phosphotriesterase-related protein